MRGGWNKGLKRNQELRVCIVCNKAFWFRLCYAKRKHRTGICCSSACRKKFHVGVENPNAGPLVLYGSKRVQHERQLRVCAKIRHDALIKIARVHNKGIECFSCRCAVYDALQINHIHGVIKSQRKKEMGSRLGRLVLRVSDEEARQQFDIRCPVCNWAHFIERKFGIIYEITSRKENNK
jgi:hypothetical protein